MGVTLICLLTGNKSTQIQNLIDEDDPSQIRFRHLLPKLSLRFLDWLQMMVEPRLKNRFANAQQALNALTPLDVTRCPQVEFSHQIKDFIAIRLGEKIRESITIENAIPDTVLKGHWEVAPHPHDPPHTANSHPWISITPKKFAGNHTKCDIEVDTSQLMADKLYKRQLLLHTNAYPATHALTVKVQTALMPIEKRESKSYASLIWAFLTGEILTFTVFGIIPWIVATLASHNIGLLPIEYSDSGSKSFIESGSGAFIFGTTAAILGAVLGVLIGEIDHFLHKKYDSWKDITPAIFRGAIIVGVLGTIIGGVYGTIFDSNRPSDLVSIILKSLWGIVWGGFFASIVGGIAGAIIGFPSSFLMRAILKIVNDRSSLLAAAFGVSVGLGFAISFLNTSTILALVITGIPFLYTLFYAPIQHQKLISKYRNSEKNLIQP